MPQRLIGAAILVPVVVVLFVLGPPWLTLGIAALAALGAYETARLVTAAGLKSSVVLPVVVAPILVLGLAWAVGPGAPPLAWAVVPPAIAAVIIVAAFVAFEQREPRNGFLLWIGTIFACLYPSLIGFAAAFIGLSPAPLNETIAGFHIDTGRMWLLILVATVWTLDTGAYVAGRLIGRGRFMNHISPNKTWSGAIGGTVAATAVCALLFSVAGLGFVGGAVMGFLLAITAQAGDLAESLLKRAAGAKDSGSLIPGHGGFLDRIDSFLFAAPTLYAALIFVAMLRVLGFI
jgi:phosphatidate cytidylyltransferase